MRSTMRQAPFLRTQNFELVARFYHFRRRQQERLQATFAGLPQFPCGVVDLRPVDGHRSDLLEAHVGAARKSTPKTLAHFSV